MKRVYLASPFFNERELELVSHVEKVLREKHGLTVFSPRENQLDTFKAGTPEWSTDIFRNDVKYIDWAECVVCIYTGNYSDSGTSWELGYAYGTNKPIILIHLRDSDSNLMCHESAHANIYIDELEDYDFTEFKSKRYQGKMF